MKRNKVLLAIFGMLTGYVVVSCQPSLPVVDVEIPSKETSSPKPDPALMSEPQDRTPDSFQTRSLQQDNPLPMTEFEPLLSSQLHDNRMGDMITLHPVFQSEPPYELANRISQKGLTWMRLSYDVFDWIEVEQTGAYSQPAIDPIKKKAIAALAEEGIGVIYNLVFWDPAIVSTMDDYSRFASEIEIDRFLEYVRLIVGDLKGQVDYYALLNETNIGQGTQQYVQVDDYISLLEATVPVIRALDPEARIIAGEVTPLNETNALNYLDAIITSTIVKSVDGISWHLSNGASPEYQSEFYYGYPGIVRELQQVAESHGFTGEYFATEMHWRTSETPHESEFWGYQTTVAAKYLARGIVTNLGLGCYAGLAENLEDPEKMPVIKNLSTLMDHAQPEMIPVVIDTDATNLVYYGFSFPYGDMLFAVWRDTPADDRFQSSLMTLTFDVPGVERVVAIDVMNSVEQEMIVLHKNGALVLENVVLMDYPIIFLLKGNGSD